MFTPLNFKEFTKLLDQVQYDLWQFSPEAAIFTATMRATGLRANEVLQLDRWQGRAEEEVAVRLEKGEKIRLIPRSTLPPEFLDLLQGKGWPLWVSYAAMNHILARTMPVLMMDSDKRRTVAHSWRYWYMKWLYEEQKLSIKEIQAIMCHKSYSSTAQYVLDSVNIEQGSGGGSSTGSTGK